MSLAFTKRFPVGREGKTVSFSFYKESAEPHSTVNFTIESSDHDPIVMLKHSDGQWRFLQANLVDPDIGLLEKDFSDALTDYGA